MLKRLLNNPERITYTRLCDACARHSAEVHTKVRLADVLPIERSGISDELYQFALQSHYDFVITERDHEPLFAVEFDGPQHDDPPQIDRDQKKNEISRKFHLELLRVQAADLYRTELRLDRLTDLIEKWFAEHPEIASGKNASQTKAVCPLCGEKMIQKRGKYGPFLSCVRYPECTGARDLPKSLLHVWGKTLAAVALIAAIVALSLAFLFGWFSRGDQKHRPQQMSLQQRQEFADAIIESEFPTCPKCGKPMRLRQNSRTGEPFFGCSDFPNCRATRDVQYPK